MYRKKRENDRMSNKSGSRRLLKAIQSHAEMGPVNDGADFVIECEDEDARGNNEDENGDLAEGTGSEISTSTTTGALPLRIKIKRKCPDESSMAQLKSQQFTTVTSLNIVDVTIKEKYWFEPQTTNCLRTLRLYFYTLDKSCKTSDPLKLKALSSLEHLILWPKENQTPILSMSHLSGDLKTLAVSRHFIRHADASKVVFPHVNKIAFRDISWDPEFVDKLPVLFPQLCFIFVSGVFNQPGPALIKALLKMKTVKDIFVGDFDSKLMKKVRGKRYSKLKKLMSNAKIVNRSEGCHFKLIREAPPQSSRWKCEGISKTSEYARLIYDSFDFETFYTFSSWRESVWEKDLY